MTKSLTSAALYRYASGFGVRGICHYVSRQRSGHHPLRAQLVRLQHVSTAPTVPDCVKQRSRRASTATRRTAPSPTPRAPASRSTIPRGCYSGARHFPSPSRSTRPSSTRAAGPDRDWDCRLHRLRARARARTTGSVDQRRHRHTERHVGCLAEPHTWYAVSAGSISSRCRLGRAGARWARGDRVLAAANVAVAGRAEAEGAAGDCHRGTVRIAALSRPPRRWAATARFNGKLGDPTVSTIRPLSRHGTSPAPTARTGACCATWPTPRRTACTGSASTPRRAA